MKLNKNIINFRKGFIVCPNDFADNRIDVAVCNAELMKFGYMFTEEAFKKLARADTAFIREYTKQISSSIAATIGDGIWKPLHANFPESVMSMNIFERYCHNIAHYWTNGEYRPDQEVIDAGYSYEHIEFKFIDAGEEKDHMNIFTSLVKVNNSIAPVDMQTIEWFADTYTYEELKEAMPASIPFKENLTVLGAKRYPVPVKTPTDVLRIAHYMSHGNTDLFIPPKLIKGVGWSRGLTPNPDYESRKFKSFSKPERRFLLALLEECAYVVEMVTHRMQWLRLGERIHPGDFHKRYPKAVEAFRKLRKYKIRSWYSKVNLAFKESYTDGINELAKRPGVFARKIDALIRKANPSNREYTITSFIKSAAKVSNKVLWELYVHFKNRAKKKERVVFIKGSRKPTFMKELEPLDESLIDIMIEAIWSTFYNKFSELEDLGAVWIDEDLKNIPAPVNMRTLSEGLITVVRGQRNPIKADKKVLRCYCHWKSQYDLDLSIEFCTADGTKSDVCGFTNYPTYGVYSSGDIIPSHGTANAKGYAEYVDIVLDDIPFDYALMMVNNYSGHPLNKAKAVIGFMERDSHQSGNSTWLPASVTNAFKLDSSAIRIAAILIDLRTKEWILVDQDSNGLPVSNGSVIHPIVKQTAEIPEVSAYHILKHHAEARGKIVAEKEDADVVYEFKDFSSSYEKILEFMI